MKKYFISNWFTNQILFYFIGCTGIVVGHPFDTIKVILGAIQIIRDTFSAYFRPLPLHYVSFGDTGSPPPPWQLSYFRKHGFFKTFFGEIQFKTWMFPLQQVRQQAFHGESNLRKVVVSCLKHEGVSNSFNKQL